MNRVLTDLSLLCAHSRSMRQDGDTLTMMTHPAFVMECVLPGRGGKVALVIPAVTSGRRILMVLPLCVWEKEIDP